MKVGTKLGIHDKGGMQFSATGDPTQEDCADVSTNTTSYLLVMQANGMLKHHTVDATMSKANLAKGLMTLNPVKYWSALVGDPEGEGERPEICGRSLAIRPGRERCRSEGRGLVHQGPRVRGTKVGTPDGQGYLQILSLSPSFALVLVPPSTPRSSACDRMTDDELAAIISRAKLTEQQWVPETCISASQIMSPNGCLK